MRAAAYVPKWHKSVRVHAPGAFARRPNLASFTHIARQIGGRDGIPGESSKGCRYSPGNHLIASSRGIENTPEVRYVERYIRKFKYLFDDLCQPTLEFSGLPAHFLSEYLVEVAGASAAPGERGSTRSVKDAGEIPRQADRFDLDIGIEPFGPLLPPQSGMFYPAERRERSYAGKRNGAVFTTEVTVLAPAQ